MKDYILVKQLTLPQVTVPANYGAMSTANVEKIEGYKPIYISLITLLGTNNLNIWYNYISLSGETARIDLINYSTSPANITPVVLVVYIRDI